MVLFSIDPPGTVPGGRIGGIAARERRGVALNAKFDSPKPVTVGFRRAVSMCRGQAGFTKSPTEYTRIAGNGVNRLQRRTRTATAPRFLSPVELRWDSARERFLCRRGQ